MYCWKYLWFFSLLARNVLWPEPLGRSCRHIWYDGLKFAARFPIAVLLTLARCQVSARFYISSRCAWFSGTFCFLFFRNCSKPWFFLFQSMNKNVVPVTLKPTPQPPQKWTQCDPVRAFPACPHLSRFSTNVHSSYCLLFGVEETTPILQPDSNRCCFWCWLCWLLRNALFFENQLALLVLRLLMTTVTMRYAVSTSGNVPRIFVKRSEAAVVLMHSIYGEHEEKVESALKAMMQNLIAQVSWVHVGSGVLLWRLKKTIRIDWWLDDTNFASNVDRRNRLYFLGSG